ncbi:TetR/AcrR family transcriptional regulator [Luteolibacter algae]|uniref:TetR/AcrR family transcriptional regulator n=1 Tax=Luteolibacter algae TaxID=454151 RepID=A0ABW5D4N5_9BACT
MKIPDSGAKKKLLDAAERLVAENGFDLVSVRDITGEVKANVAAVNYHFGSRETLMDLVVLRLLQPLLEERLKALDGAGKKPSVEKIIDSFASPLLSIAGSLGMDQFFFLRLIGRILVLPPAKISQPLSTEWQAMLERYQAALENALPDMPSARVAARFAFFDAGLSQSLLGLEPSDDFAELLQDWIAFASQGFGAVAAPTKQKKDDPQELLLFDF